MTIQTINIGNYANDGSGDDLRTAFQKVNANFAALSSEVTIANAVNLGGAVDNGAGIFAQRNNADLQFKTLVCDDNSITYSSSPQLVTLRANTILHKDSNPMLGANLNLNGFNVTGNGDVQTTVNGFNVGMMHSLMSLLLASNQNINVDLGSYEYPTGKTTENILGTALDFGTFTSPAVNNINFGLL